MTHGLRLLPAAYRDIQGGVAWYARQQGGLGQRFEAVLQETLNRIADNPFHYAPRFDQVRKARLHRFPYGVYFRIEPDHVLIAAVLHDSRNPELWRQRLK